MRVNFTFLKPRLLNTLLTIIVFSLPIMSERATLPDGTFAEVVYYRPIYLLTLYLQMQEWQAALLMTGFLLVIYLVVSILIAVSLKLIKKNK